MPWISKSVIAMREEFIKFVLREELSFSELCMRYNISRKTGYKWFARYEAGGFAGLSDESRAPKSIAKRTSRELEEAVVKVRLEHCCWGGRKIRHYLLNKGYKYVPAASTITDILHRHGLIRDREELERRFWLRFEHENANDLWQMDFKGHFPMADGKRCYPLTIVDDHSRFSIAVNACLNEQGITVKSALLKVFERYGLPRRINVDNGNPWGSLFEVCRYTTFGLWLIDQGIGLSHSRPNHPQTNGKNERFNRTLKEEVIRNSYISSLGEAQEKFDKWRHIYNFERPHEAIGYNTPSQLYKPSYREYKSKVEEFHYSEDYVCKIVDVRGRVNIEGRAIYVGTPFSKKQLGLRHNDSNSPNSFDVYYRHQRLGQFNLNNIEKGACFKLYSTLT